MLASWLIGLRWLATKRKQCKFLKSTKKAARGFVIYSFMAIDTVLDNSHLLYWKTKIVNHPNLWKWRAKKLIVYVNQSFVYNKHILVHEMSRILSLPFLQNHFYHLNHSSWLQAKIISTKLEQIPSKSWTSLFQPKSRWRAEEAFPAFSAAKKFSEDSRRWTDRATTNYEHNQVFFC